MKFIPFYDNTFKKHYYLFILLGTLDEFERSSRLFKLLGLFFIYIASRIIIIVLCSILNKTLVLSKSKDKTLLSLVAPMVLFYLLCILCFDVLLVLHRSSCWFDRCKFDHSIGMAFRRLAFRIL